MSGRNFINLCSGQIAEVLKWAVQEEKGGVTRGGPGGGGLGFWEL